MNAIVNQAPQPWYELFNALKYVDNPFALLGLMMLACIVALSLIRIAPKVKIAFLFILTVILIGTVFMLLKDTLGNVERQSLVRLVQSPGQTRAEINEGVEVELADVTSLEGKSKEGIKISGQAFNRLLPYYVQEGVLRKAKVMGVSGASLHNMTQEQWETFLDEIGPVKAEWIKDAPFTRLLLFVDGQEADNSNRWWFKGQVIPIKTRDGTIKLRVANIYNTKDQTSEEKEAVNLQLLHH